MDRDIAETHLFQPVRDGGEGRRDAAEYDQTVDSASRPVAVSVDADGIAVLGRLLEAKRGQVPSFETVKQLAEGGMGAVLVAQDKALQRRVAVKVMKPEIAESEEKRARFLEEAQVTGQLEHPNIVPIHDLGQDADGNLYFTMKLVKGQSLGQILAGIKEDPSGGRSLTSLLNIVLKIADGLAFAHSKGVVHRDLKPDNIMVGDFGEVFIMDWGLAKLLGRGPQGSSSPAPVAPDASSDTADNAQQQTIHSVRASENVAQTVDGTVQGTPAYMPPEQARGQVDQIDPRSDIYALGAILYEILTLEPPVAGKTYLDVVMNAAEGKIVPPEQRAPRREIPAELSAVAMKALETSPDDRYQTVQEFERDISLFLEGRAVSAKVDTPFESLVKLIRRNKAVSAAIAVAATIIVVLATVSYVRISRERDRAVASEKTAIENEQRAVRGETLARENEQKAQANEQKAVEAQRRQWETALAASKQFALQAVELANVNRLEPAKRRAEDAAVVAPDGPWQDFATGAIAMAQQDYVAASDLYRTALAKPDGDQPEIRAALADALARQGNLEEAEAILAKLDEITDWRILLSAGRALYAAHNWDACEQPLSRAIELMEQEKDRPNSSLVEAQRLLEAAPAQRACEGFYDEIRNFPFRQQYTRVAEKLTEIHGSKFNYLDLHVNSDGRLSYGMAARQGTIRHLYPFRGLPIVNMGLGFSAAWDLSPLKGMPLRKLSVGGCKQLTDLGPLSQSHSLHFLDCHGSSVKDLSPLQGLQLRQLNCGLSRVESLAPLSGMPLEVLNIGGTRVSDLTPLRGMPLKEVDLSGCHVQDLSPLKDCPIEKLRLNRTRVKDLAPLSGMPLKDLELQETKINDLSPLKGCPIETLNLAVTRVTDLAPLRGMLLETLNLWDCTVADLSPLAETSVRRLDLGRARISDLSPLRNLALDRLGLAYTDVTDLSPLVGSSVTELIIFGCWIKDYSPLASMDNLDRQANPWIPFLLGEITEQQFHERMQERRESSSTAEAVTRHAVIFVAMKKYADDGPAAAIAVLEKYKEKWGTQPPPGGAPVFIEASIKRLREELAAQPDAASSEPTAP